MFFRNDFFLFFFFLHTEAHKENPQLWCEPLTYPCTGETTWKIKVLNTKSHALIFYAEIASRLNIKAMKTNYADAILLMDFTSQVHGAIKSSNLLRADRNTIDKKSERWRDSRVYVSGVWGTVSSWMRSWLCSPYMWGGQRVEGFGKSRCKTWLEAR